MPSTERHRRAEAAGAQVIERFRLAVWPVALFLLFALPLCGQEKRLFVYAPQMYFQVSISDQKSIEYVGLLELLEPLGKVESRVDGKKWKLRFTGAGPTAECEFREGKRKGKVRGNEFELSADFLLQGDRGYVPVNSLPALLPRILEKTVDLHAASRRLFVGGAASRLSLDLKRNPTRLVAIFPAPVSPQVSTDGSHVRVVFSRDPVVSSGIDVVAYTEPPIASTNFSESNGNAVLDVVGTVPLQAIYSDGGKTLTIAALQQAANAPVPQPPTSTSSGQATLPAATETEAKPKPSGGQRAYYVALDAGHGGVERGAQLTDTINEKDVTLALARRIQRELEARGITVYFVRGADATLSSDQRASSSNGSRAAVYVGIHAATLGNGLRVFTAMMPPSSRASRHTFLPWNTAQAAFLESSEAVASSIATECKSRNVSVKALAAPVRPLNNIAGAAIAIEIAPQTDSVESLTDAKYQQEIASAVAAGIAAARSKLEGAQ